MKRKHAAEQRAQAANTNNT